MDKKTRLKFFISLAISLSMAGLFLLSVGSRPYQILELKALDLRFVLKGSHPSSAPVVHIDIDDQSLGVLGRWPWPRHYHAKLFSILKECGARQVLMDVLFSEQLKDNPQDDALFASAMAASGLVYLPFYFNDPQPQVILGLRLLLAKDITISVSGAAKALRADAKLLQEQLPLEKKALLQEAARDMIAQDPGISFEALLEGFERQRGWFLFTEDEAYLQEQFESQKLQRAFLNKFSLSLSGGRWPFSGRISGSLSVPIRQYVEAMKGSGFINAPADLDGVTRKVQLFMPCGDKLLPQLTMAALIDLLEVKDVQPGGGCIVLKGARLNGGNVDISIPVDRQGRMLVNWQGKWGESFKHLPYYLILRLQDIRDQLRKAIDLSPENSAGIQYLKKSESELMSKLRNMVEGKVCIVGLTATGTHDLRPVPLQANYPMVGTHSSLINTVFSGKFILRQGELGRVLVFLTIALLIALSSLLKLWKSLLLSLSCAGIFFLAAYLMFSYFGIWIDMVGPLGIVIFSFAAITCFRFFTEEKEKLWIKQAFSHYLSNEVINELMADPSRLKLGGERRMISVFFSDVRGFTSFSEGHKPEEVVAMLNEILSAQVKVVFKHNGTLDKFVGDELMAFWGAPGNRHLNDHALLAVRSALEIQARMRELREKWAQENKAPLQIGIGINTGEMVVGNMGSAERMDYTVIGDNVNLGARLCSAAAKDEIIISESAYELVKNEVIAEKLEPITVKGKANPISIYKVKGLKQE